MGWGCSRERADAMQGEPVTWRKLGHVVGREACICNHRLAQPRARLGHNTTCRLDRWKAPLQHRSRQQRAGQQQQQQPPQQPLCLHEEAALLGRALGLVQRLRVLDDLQRHGREREAHSSMPSCSAEVHKIIRVNANGDLLCCHPGKPRHPAAASPGAPARHSPPRCGSPGRAGRAQHRHIGLADGQGLTRQQTMMSELSASPHHNCLPARQWGSTAHEPANASPSACFTTPSSHRWTWKSTPTCGGHERSCRGRCR